MPLNPAIEGATLPAQLITWKRRSRAGTAAEPVDLTGATITGTIADPNGENQRAITGTLEIASAEAGQFFWTYSEQDVGTPGYFHVQFTATYEEGVEKSFAEGWEVVAAQ